jgi:hypothetical protein
MAAKRSQLLTRAASAFAFAGRKAIVADGHRSTFKDEEDRKKVKDDTMVIDRDIRMAHLWLEYRKKGEKRLTAAISRSAIGGRRRSSHLLIRRGPRPSG